jgi:hypothetical protein
MRDGGVVTVELRTNMWRFWLTAAIDAAVTAAGYADRIPPLYEQFEAGKCNRRRPRPSCYQRAGRLDAGNYRFRLRN